MRSTMKYRTLIVLSALVVSVVGVGLAGATTASAAPKSAAGRPASGRVVANVASGTYNFYSNGEALGQLYLNSNSSWSMSEFEDSGTWSEVGSTLGMSDTAPAGLGAAWAAKVSGTKLGSEKKPGEVVTSGHGSSTWYAVYDPSGGPRQQARSALAPFTLNPRISGSTFPGTYTTWTGTGGEDYPTVFNSDSSWSATGHCNAGSYVSFNRTIVMDDEGCGADELWMATEHGARKLGTSKKPGVVASASAGGNFQSWYAVLDS
jgi:hypothetical protein